jgi:hypothetical protein
VDRDFAASTNELYPNHKMCARGLSPITLYGIRYQKNSYPYERPSHCGRNVNWRSKFAHHALQGHSGAMWTSYRGSGEGAAANFRDWNTLAGMLRAGAASWKTCELSFNIRPILDIAGGHLRANGSSGDS